MSLCYEEALLLEKDLERLKALRTIAPMNEILDHAEVAALAEGVGKAVLGETITQVIDDYRKQLLGDKSFAASMSHLSRQEITLHLVQELKDKLDAQDSTCLKKLINATGIVLHTNLGRAPLPDSAIGLIQEVNEGYSNLEFDLETGNRGSRHTHIEPLITRLTGAESAMVVNNNAAAVFISLNTLAKQRDVIISRGQQVEIGGSFRIPDIIASSGCTMIEVGTTNKTKPDDYAKAITENTAVLLKVHTSNYKISGFTEEVPLQDLVELGKIKNVLVMEDLGSGCLYDLSKIGLPHEPTVQEVIAGGADLVTFSGDKLLGGPQIGVIAGKKALIDKIKKNPFARIVRCDKSSIAALTAVLKLYMNPEKALAQIPALNMLALKEADLLLRAEELERQLQAALGERCQVEIVDVHDEAGGGSLPDVLLKGKAVSLTIDGLSANRLQELLRQEPIPIICRIVKDKVLLNVRTMSEKEFPLITQTMQNIVG
ncbi:L-seryl-tRNA(Sec) selenium transferase [Desulfitobacterium hafniense DP7]|uniref:L-seryl-tRNA(Sec) selenium transferase n=1 Tax=Desulfitobacterium hafniense DP7 TaxID=537010 RepID=G9XUX0_DESHA|nr:L-seryl-tRNA(Sec) selenium transferase [Desulfitobacterium hafniense DP7]